MFLRRPSVVVRLSNGINVRQLSNNATFTCSMRSTITSTLRHRFFTCIRPSLVAFGRTTSSIPSNAFLSNFKSFFRQIFAKAKLLPKVSQPPRTIPKHRSFFSSSIVRSPQRFKSFIASNTRGIRSPFSLGFAAAFLNEDNFENSPLSAACTHVNFLFKGASQFSDIGNRPVDFKNISLVKFLGEGCNAVVFDATDSSNERPITVKMMFNYEFESNSAAILSGMRRELIPYRGSFGVELQDLISPPCLKPHPNIIELLGVFTDRTMNQLNEMSIDTLSKFREALPRSWGGMGREMTLFIVMRRFDIDLQKFLSHEKPKMSTSLTLLSQLFAGIDHLRSNGIAHRDLKSNNILLDVSEFGTKEHPWLVISDFGCATDEIVTPYFSLDQSRGGNAALMAPEIIGAKLGSKLDFRCSDLWACGAICYEIMGQMNPFYSGLTSSSYSERDLPLIESSPIIDRLLKACLRRSPKDRPEISIAFMVSAILKTIRNADIWRLLQIIRQPSDRDKSLINWIQRTTMETVFKRRIDGKPLSNVEIMIRGLLLEKIETPELIKSIKLMSGAFEVYC